MPLPDEVPFTAEELVEIEQLVRSVLTPIQSFTHQATAAVIPPEVFLLLPAHQERLETLIDCFTLICDLLPPDYFEHTKWELLECRDRLLAVEAYGTLASQSQPLFGSLGVEVGPKGYHRLALPREVIEIMITEGDLNNTEIADLLGERLMLPVLATNLLICSLFVGCGLRTLKRRLREWGIVRRHQNITDAKLATKLYEIKKTVGVFYGERAMIGILHSMGYWAPREKIRHLLRQIDPQGISDR